MWQILGACFWKFIKLSNSGFSLHRSIDEVTTRNKFTVYFLAHSVYTLTGLKTAN